MTGKPAVDLGDHAVPVIEHVEGDDRGHDQEREKVDEGHSARPDRSEQACNPPGDAAADVGDRARYVGFRLGHQQLEPAGCRLVEQLDQGSDIAWNISGEIGDLLSENRKNKQKQDGQPERAQDENEEGCGKSRQAAKTSRHFCDNSSNTLR